jgi:hypothetical protein
LAKIKKNCNFAAQKTKYMKPTFFIPLLIVAFVACQPSDEQSAATLVAEAHSLVDNGQWRQARIVLDSIHVKYPKQVAQRRLAKALEDSITFLEAQTTLAYVDTLLPPLLEQADQLIKKFKYEKKEQYEDYGKYVHNLLVTNTNTSRNFIQAYVLDNRTTTVKSYYYGNVQVNQRAIALSASGEERTFVGRNYHFQDGAHHEIMTFDEENALALLNFISTYQNDKIRVEGKGGKTIQNWVYYLTNQEKKALSDTYQLGWLMKDINRLEQMQKTASAQINRYNQK